MSMGLIRSVSAEQFCHARRKGPFRPAPLEEDVRTSRLVPLGARSVPLADRAVRTVAEAAARPSSGWAAAPRGGQGRGCHSAWHSGSLWTRREADSPAASLGLTSRSQ